MLARASLLTRLMILVLVGTLPAVLVLMFLQQDLRQERRADITSATLRQAELLNADMINVVEGARQLIIAVSREARVAAMDPACGGYLARLRADLPAYQAISVMRDDGSVLCSSDPDEGRTEAGRLASLARVALATPRFKVGTLAGQPGRRGFVLPFSRPFRTAAGGRAVVVAMLSLDWLREHLTEARRDADNAITVADRDGTILAQLPDAAHQVGHSLAAAQMALLAQPEGGTRLVRDADGSEDIVAFVPPAQPPEGLLVSVSVRLSTVLAEVDRTTWRGTVLIVLGALLSLWLALLLGERFVRKPTALLIEAARRWSAGDLAARATLDEAAGSEFGRLATAFNDMAEALGRQRDELQALNAALEARADQRGRDLVESRNRLQVETAERERTEAELRQAQKLQAVGQLAGGIAHDFNNLLTAITGALELLRDRLAGQGDDIARLVEHALRAAERGGRLTGQLLTFSRRQRLLPAPTDVNAAVQTVLGLFGGALGTKVTLRTALAADLWPAMVDPNQFDAALLNLAINARDAMPEGGALRIETFNARAPDDIKQGPAMAPGDYVVVRVADEGVGMPADVLARVFEPFFTTKGPDRGSGLGLSQVHGLAVQSGGDVRIESSPGRGTVVTLLLPRAMAEPARQAAPGAGATGGARTARVLVVDDDRAVREMIGTMLVDRGHIVTLAADGAEGLAVLERDLKEAGGSIELLLADFVMPGMTGMELIRAARRMRPGLKCLLVTGHAEFRPTDEVRPEDVMRKPFTMAVLDARIRQVLAPRGEAA